MSRPRRILAVTTVAATVMTVAGTGWSGASPTGGEETHRHGQALHRAWASPAAGITSRGADGNDRGRGKRQAQPPAEDEPQTPPEKNKCPEESWTLPLQLNGLGCVLLLPKPEDPPAAPPAA